MDFCNLQIEEIHSVVRYRSTLPGWRTQKRKDHIIGVQLCGRAFHDFGYQQFYMEPNSVYFLNQREDYTVQVVDPGEAFSIHFTTTEELDTDSFCFPVSDPGKLIALLQKAETELRSKKHLRLFAACYQFCAELDRLRDKTYFPKDARALEGKAFIDAHFHEPGCFEATVAQSGLCARRFGALFRNTFQMTPNRYITFCRIEHAKHLLRTRAFSIAEIARQCGFSDVYYFSKVFKQETGVPPSKWS